MTLSMFLDWFIARLFGEPADVVHKPKDLLPEGVKLVPLANGRFHVVFPCGEELRTDSGEGWTVEQARTVVNVVVGEARRQRQHAGSK